MFTQLSLGRLKALSALAALTAVACGGPTINAQRDANVPLPAGASWAWGTRDTISRYELDPAVQNPLLHQYVQRAIENSLNAKGFRRVEDPGQAQVIVTYHMGLKRTTEYVTSSTGVGMYGGYYGGYGWGVYGAPTWSSSTTRPIEYSEGGVLVIIRDRASNQVAWQGVYKKDVHDVNQVTQESIQLAANDLFAELRP